MSAPAFPRIGYVVKRYPRYSETFIVNEILAHERAGLDVRVFSLLPPEDTHFQDIISRVRSPVFYLPAHAGKASDFWNELGATAARVPAAWKDLSAGAGSDAREIRQALALAGHVVEQGISHLHAHFASATASVARLAARWSNTTYSFTAHAKDIFHESVDGAALARKFADAAFAVTVSDYNLHYLRARIGRCADKLVRIYNGLDLAVFPFDAPHGRSPQIVAVGRLVEKKGFTYLVEACRILRSQGLDFQCRLIGAGPLDGELRAQIEAGSLSRIVEMCGPLPQQSVIDRLRAASVFAAPCVVGSDNNQDGLPTVLLEAMALGTPCVSTDVTGIPEVVKNGQTGLVVAQKDPAQLAGALASLLADAGRRASLAREGRVLIEQRFDVHRNAAELRRHFLAHARAREPVERVA